MWLRSEVPRIRRLSLAASSFQRPLVARTCRSRACTRAGRRQNTEFAVDGPRPFVTTHFISQTHQLAFPRPFRRTIIHSPTRVQGIDKRWASRTSPTLSRLAHRRSELDFSWPALAFCP
ncbi:hypothetical protein IQ06DRAFT_150373 [Phaeosphaeriaceae sp. SRC1lsM3a]|nr:hypothetical protein IQ06DRAFT_150373 [Stagonospora sp. SRC1lsM3a]